MKNNTIVLYKSLDGKVELATPIDGDTVWLTVNQMSRLFNRDVSNIRKHIKSAFDDGELDFDSNVRELSLDSAKQGVNTYSLDVVISVGYRVKSQRGVEFRIWATKILREYVTKGFAMDDDRLKSGGDKSQVYFEELLARIRDIRASEKNFWRKVLDIYATSVDYDPRSQTSLEFFKTVQNKMHHAVHGRTAAEVIFDRVDANKENVGLTNFRGRVPTRHETEIAKNYLTEQELDVMNRMVNAYLDVAEIQALSRTPMTMTDWKKELDGFLTMTRKKILDNAGSVSHAQALEKAHREYDKYMQTHLTEAEQDYLAALESEAKKIEKLG